MTCDKVFAADGKTEIQNSGYGLMVMAHEFNRVHGECESLKRQRDELLVALEESVGAMKRMDALLLKLTDSQAQEV